MSITWTYEVTKENHVKMIGDNGQSTIVKSWANGTPFTAETILVWADANLESLNNPDCEFIVGPSPEEPTILKADIEAELAAQNEPLEIESSAE